MEIKIKYCEVSLWDRLTMSRTEILTISPLVSWQSNPRRSQLKYFLNESSCVHHSNIGDPVVAQHNWLYPHNWVQEYWHRHTGSWSWSWVTFIFSSQPWKVLAVVQRSWGGLARPVTSFLTLQILRQGIWPRLPSQGNILGKWHVGLAHKNNCLHLYD